MKNHTKINHKLKIKKMQLTFSFDLANNFDIDDEVFLVHNIIEEMNLSFLDSAYSSRGRKPEEQKQYETKINRVVADSSYESEENYLYLKEKQIKAFIKPSNHEMKKTKNIKVIFLEKRIWYIVILVITIYVLIIKN